MNDIVERLRTTTDGVTVNPDGLEAAFEIERLRDEIERLTKYDEVLHLRATNARLRAALTWINHQRYTGRSTINPENGYDRAVALNTKLLAVMDVARGTLAQGEPNE